MAVKGKMELLAPAGNLDCGLAAFRYGADAVYLGMRQFSARADAENFSAEELQVLLGVARKDPQRPRKVYAAVNTLAYDRELDGLLEELVQLCSLGVDALIIQDWGVYSLVRRYFPAQVLHASTQMAIHNREGVEAASELGFSRVIAAREMTLPELAEMAAVPGMELEVFVQGALCYAYSGLCLLSSVLRGASGNRGECTYVCRNSCQVESWGGRQLSPRCNLMSMKDLSLGEMLPQLEQAGVRSLKIEGRKKSPLYVSAVTDYYRKLLDGEITAEGKQECEERIRTIFSRPWTKFHVVSRKAPQVTDIRTVGHRGVPVGTVSAVVPGEGGQPDRLRFFLENHPLERHDGLQLELAGQERPFGFPVEAIYTFRQGNFEDGCSVCQAAAGSTIEVPLPENHPQLAEGMTVFCASSQAVKRSYTWPSARPALDKLRCPVCFRLQIAERSLAVSAECGGQGCEVKLELEEGLSAAKNPQATERAAQAAFERLGDSDLLCAGLRVENPGGLFVPSSQLNELRRQVVAKFSQFREERSRQLRGRGTEELRHWQPGLQSESAEVSWQVKIDRAYYLNVLSAAEVQRLSEVIFELGRTSAEELSEALAALEQKVGRSRLRLALPTIIRPGQLQDWGEVARRLYREGWRRWQVSNPGGWQLLRAAAGGGELELTADWQFYASNSAAARSLLEELGLRSLTLMPDDELENTRCLAGRLGERAAVLLFQDTPLAISDVCANASLHGGCPGKSACAFRQFTLNLRNGERLLVVNDNCQSVYLRASPLDRREDWRSFQRDGARLFRLDFLWREYSPVAVQRCLAETWDC